MAPISNIAFATALLLAASVSAGPVSHRPKRLAIRQAQPSIDQLLNTIPTQCRDTCRTFFTTALSCGETDLTCLCAPANGQSLQSCVTCFVSVAPIQSQVDKGQALLDEFNGECASTGAPALSVGVTAPPVQQTGEPTTSFGVTPLPSPTPTGAAGGTTNPGNTTTTGTNAANGANGTSGSANGANGTSGSANGGNGSATNNTSDGGNSAVSGMNMGGFRSALAVVAASVLALVML